MVPVEGVKYKLEKVDLALGEMWVSLGSVLTCKIVAEDPNGQAVYVFEVDDGPANGPKSIELSTYMLAYLRKI